MICISIGPDFRLHDTAYLLANVDVIFGIIITIGS